MSKTDNLHDFLVDIADAIREKKGTTEEYSEAIDIEGAPYTYEETDKEIEQYEEPI